MTDEQKADLVAKINETIIQTEKEIKRLEPMVQPIKPENSLGRISRMDAINNKGVAEVSMRSNKRKLGKLKAALLKIDEPGFGACARCRRPIATARLMLMPESTNCVRCAR